MSKRTTRETDPFCSKLYRPGLPTISGGAAREARIALHGGIHKMLRNLDAFVKHTDELAAKKAAKQLPANVVAFRKKVA
jgi:hypothetical protein